MSHLSKIKTKITDTEILKNTLSDLELKWVEACNQVDKTPNTIHLDIADKENLKSAASFTWNGNSYEIIADSYTWQHKRLLDAMVEKIHQKYAHNIIMDESRKQGFSHTNTNILQDGSLRIVLERWKS